MLKNIKITGYKSIENLNLDLKPINILIGSNGVGKSNFINFFKLINNIYEQRLQQYVLKSGAENLLRYGRKHTSHISGVLSFGDNAYKVVLAPTESDSLMIEREESIYTPNRNNPIFWSTNLLESAIKNSNDYRDTYLRGHLSSFKIYHFHDTSTGSSLRTSAKTDDNRALRENGDNLAAYLYYLQKKTPKTFNRIEKTIQMVAPFFDRFNLEPDRLDQSRIKLVWNEKGKEDIYFDSTHLSDGSLRFIALATLLLQPELPSTIIIDEPELGLHPVAINKLAGLIKSAAQQGCQVIVSTQSVNLLNNFTAEDIITVDKENDQSTFQRLNSENLSNWLKDFTIGELWTKSVIKGQPL